MKKLVTLLIAVIFLTGCLPDKKTTEIEQPKVKVTNIGYAGIRVVFLENTVTADKYNFYENFETVKEINERGFNKGDTLLILHKLKDSTDYSLSGIEKFDKSDRYISIIEHFWYDPKGDTLIFNPPFGEAKGKLKVY